MSIVRRMARWLIIACATLTLASCADRRSPPMIDLVFLTRDGCANTDRMRANLDQALRAVAAAPRVQVVDLDSLSATDIRRGYPTPTLLVNNVDMFGMPEPKPPLPEPT